MITPASRDGQAPILRRKLYQDVMDRLLELIERRRLRPGDTLPSERDLMDLYGVGRPAIREAIQNLSRVGILTVTHGGRTRLAEPSVSQAVEQMSLIARHVLTYSSASLDHLKQARLAQLEGQPNFQFQRAALEDQVALEHLFDQHSFSHVVHLGAQAGVRYSLENPRAYIDANISGTLNILECCRHSQDLKHLIYASSSSVYGMNAKQPFATDDAVDHLRRLHAAGLRVQVHGGGRVERTVPAAGDSASADDVVRVIGGSSHE